MHPFFFYNKHLNFNCRICYNQNMKSYNLIKDIKTIRGVFDLTQSAFADKIGLSRSNIIRYEKGEIEPHKSALEKIYSFAYENNLKVNKAKEMLYLDQKGNNTFLVHGAKNTIEGEIDHNHLNGTKDFGAGFYLSETYDSAASWIAERSNGTCYCFYFLNKKDYKILHFDVSREWMYLILYYRGAFSNYLPSKEILDLIKEVETCDLIIAPIANNNMYETINSFSHGEISDEQCLHALSANNLGLQYVFKSERACRALKFIDRLYLCEEEKKKYLNNKYELASEGRSKTEIVINEYRRKGKYFDELFKKNG